MTIAHQRHITEQDYLSHELDSQNRHEYVNGEIFAMTGASAAHNLISGNLYTALMQHLKGKTCRPYMADMKLKIGTDYFYPDVLVDCAELADDAHFTQSPILIVEVLSKSTKSYDKTFKMQRYQQIASLQEYVLIEHDIAEVEVLRKSQHWQPSYYYLGDRFNLESVKLELDVSDIYDRIKNDDMLQWLAKKSI